MFTRALFFTALGLIGCSQDRKVGPDPQLISAELKRLFDEDQAGRSGPIEAVNMDSLNRGDSVRRARAATLVATHRLELADDYYHAAMLFQHGVDSTAYREANRLAIEAERRDSSQQRIRWLTAATWDRYQVSRGQPQWFGTQPTRLEEGRGAVILAPIDTSRITDGERQWRGIGTLAELCAKLDSTNLRMNLPTGQCLARAGH